MSTADSIRISPGDVIDDFEILEVVAVGGSSTTFRAQHRTLAREVAFKFVHPAVFAEDAGAIDAARADATRIARLEHPGVAPVFAAGTHAGGLYISSASPTGQTLAELGEQRSITPTEAVKAIADVAAAIAHAHAQGVIHRDLRPDCITIDRWGNGVVRDFGVTRTSGRTGLLTRAEVLESLRYTAPELVLGRPATAATDVYGLAAVAVWSLTGAPPYHDRPAAEYVRFRTSAVAPRLALADGSPSDAINRVLTAAMALEPADRPTPAAFASALQEAVFGLPAAVRSAGCPFTASEVGGLGPRPTDAPVATPSSRDSTRVEHRRPLPAATATADAATPWGTYVAGGMLAIAVGLGGLLAGRSAAPEPPAKVAVGAFTLDPGPDWRRGAGVDGVTLDGVTLHGAGTEAATVGVITDVRLPGDPVPAAVLPQGAGAPTQAASGRTPLVSYEGDDTLVLARPTSKGTLVAACAGTTLERCAALLVNAKGPGVALPVAPSPAASDGLREAMAALTTKMGIATGGLLGDKKQRADAAKNLWIALQDAASGLAVKDVDPATAQQLKRVGKALALEGAEFKDLASAIDRKSDADYEAARKLIGEHHDDVVAALKAFGRAGYAVKG